jgi:hypothetical protein
MERLTWMLAGMLRHAAGLLPPGRQEWAEAVRTEAGQVPAGWPRLRWLAGGLWLAVREGAMMMIGKAVYRLGAVAVAALAAWVVWLSWRTSPAADAQAVTDRVRVLVGAAALVVLPWLGRRRGWFGPVRGSIAARLVRLAGCAAVCGLGVVVVRMDSHLGLGPHGPGPFSLPREITAVVLAGAAVAARAVGKARWPDVEASAPWALPAIAGLFIFVAVPLQALAIVYVAGILAATSWRSPAANVSLAVGAIAGLVAGLAEALPVYATAGDDNYVDLLVLGMLILTFGLAALAGVAAAWLIPDIEDPQELREARIRQGLLAGLVAGAACGMLLTYCFVAAVFMLVLGPLLGAGGGAVGGAIAADHPRRSRPARSWSAGLFASRW